MSLKREESRLGYLLILPALLILVFLIAYPFGYGLYLSFTDARVGNPGNFVGLKNFVDLFQGDAFRQALRNSIVFTLASVTLKAVIGLTVALILKQIVFLRKPIRAAILLPWVIPTSLSTLVWWWMFNPNFSIINWVLRNLGVVERGIPWLGQPLWAMAAVVIVNVWRGVPFFAMSFLAGLLAISPDLYEAADTEGANERTKFLYITLPLMKPILGIIALFSTLMTISEFNIIYMLTGGGPAYATHLFATLAYQEGISTGDIARGAAISIFLFPLLVVVAFLQLRMIRKGATSL